MSADNSAPPAARFGHESSPPAPAQGGHRGMRILVWILLLAVFAIAFIWVLGKHDSAQTPAGAGRRGAVGGTVPITTATAEKGDIGVYLDAIGTVTPVYTDSITSQVNGQVLAVHFKEGQIVHKGDPLIDIDPRPYRATLMQAQGTLERDQNVLAQAQMDVERYRDAWARNAIAKQILDDQEKLVLQDQGTVKNDQGTVQFDQIQLDYCHITAPISGRVGLRLVDPGNVVQSSGNLTLAVITQIKPITVVFTIPEDSLEQTVTGMHKKKLPVDAFDRAALRKIAVGTLQTLDNQIDTTTGTVKGRAVFDNKDGSLFPNQFVNIRLPEHAARSDAGSFVGDPAQRTNRVLVCDSKQHSAHANREARSDGRRHDAGGGNQSRRHCRQQQLRQIAGQSHSVGRERFRQARPILSIDPIASIESAFPTSQTRERRALSPSRPFILRPVATSLLMAAILLVGIVSYTQLPVSRRFRKSTIRRSRC